MDAETVATAWTDSLVRLGGDRSAAASSAEDLVRHYGQTHRHYHDAAHVAAVLRESSRLAGEVKLDGRSQALVALAACAHDVVYDARPGDDEQASARWAAEAIVAAGAPGAVAGRVADLVLATLDHAGDGSDTVAAVLLDADLAILGAAPADYALYAAAVRREYATVPDDLWRSGRSAVLADLLARDRLYLTAAAHSRWDAQARANMDAEFAGLNRLSGGLPPPG